MSQVGVAHTASTSDSLILHAGHGSSRLTGFGQGRSRQMLSGEGRKTMEASYVGAQHGSLNNYHTMVPTI